MKNQNKKNNIAKKSQNNKNNPKKTTYKKMVTKSKTPENATKKEAEKKVVKEEIKYSFDDEFNKISKTKEKKPQEIKYSFDDEYKEIIKKKKDKPQKVKYSFDNEYKEIIKKKKDKPQEIKYSFEQNIDVYGKKEEIVEKKVEPSKEKEVNEETRLSRKNRNIETNLDIEVKKDIPKETEFKEETRLSRRNRRSQNNFSKEDKKLDFDDELIDLLRKKEVHNETPVIEPKESEPEEVLEDNVPKEETEEETPVTIEEHNIKEVTTIEYNSHDNDFMDVINKHDFTGKNKEELVPSVKEPKKQKKLKRWVYILLLILLIGCGLLTYKIISNKKEEDRLLKEKEILADINNHYSDHVKVNENTKLYVLEDNQYNEVGIAYKDVVFNLDKQEINLDTKYFKIKDSDYYVAYESVSKSQEETINTRYKKYLPFNLDVVTKDKFTLYQDDKEMYTFNKSMELPIIINDYENKYYVEYDNRLLSIKKDDVLKTVSKKYTDKKNQSTITTLCYHMVYDKDKKCTDPYICIGKESFDKEMKYLNDNHYLTLSLSELHMYLKGSLRVEKATVITFDDGYNFKSADEVLDKYKLNGTMFVISGEFKDYSIFDNLKAIEIQSHTHKMHKNYVCPGGNQGGAILCASKKDIVTDLKTSLEALKVNPIGIAFPFYDYNDNAIAAVKEAGFKMSFVGRAGKMGKATPKETDLYKIPRMTVYDISTMSLDTWKSYL